GVEVGKTTAGTAIGRARPPAPLDAGVVDAEVGAVEKDGGDERQRRAHHPAGRAAPGRDERDEGDRHADVIGNALGEAKLAGNVAADELEAPRGENGDKPQREDDGGDANVAAGWREGFGGGAHARFPTGNGWRRRVK